MNIKNIYGQNNVRDFIVYDVNKENIDKSSLKTLDCLYGFQMKFFIMFCQ